LESIETQRNAKMLISNMLPVER